MRGEMLHLVLATAALALRATYVEAHGYLLVPRARNLIYNGGSRGPGDVQSMSAGGTAVERNEGHGLCGDLASRQEFMAPNQYGPTEPQVTAYAGQDLEIQVEITAHHWGWFEFRLCVPEDGGLDKTQPITQACLNENVLRFNESFTMNSYKGEMESGVSSPADYVGPGADNYRFEHAKCPYLPDGGLRGSCCRTGGTCSDPSDNRERWVLPKPQDEPYVMRYNIPEGISCERCVLQWFYQTGNSPDSYPEGFWNCADIRIINDGSTSPPSTAATPTLSVATPSPTSAIVASTSAPTTSSDQDNCFGNGVSDEWCRNTGCAQVYVDAGYCYFAAETPTTSNPPTLEPTSPESSPTTLTTTLAPTIGSEPPTTVANLPAPTSSSAGCYGSNIGGATDAWCQSNNCAQVYIDSGHCILSNSPSETSASPTTAPPPTQTPPMTASPTIAQVTPSNQPTTLVAPTSSTMPTEVYEVLIAAEETMNNDVLRSQQPDLTWAPSTLYRHGDFLRAVEVMHAQGAGGKHLYLGQNEDGPLYGLVNLAAFLAQSMKETIQYDACSENSWDLVNGYYPVSNACGQLGQSYQDYTCSGADAHMACEVDPTMEIVATTNAKWYGAPGPLRCAPRAKTGSTGYWDYSAECNKPWASPPETCSVYEGQQAGKEISNVELANRAGRTDLEGCCWWGRGVIQTTGVCNFGKLNYYLGARAAAEGRAAPYADVNFCQDPEAICSSTQYPELKWTAGFWYWMESVESWSSSDFVYLDALRVYVDGGMSGTAFIDAVSGIVNRGCPALSCPAGSVDGVQDRRDNFERVIAALGLREQL
ncbi:Hypothetical Protein FCC1311_034442 [Hondaea fermentalgiana]|uniref:Chitin-binding type-4 domain-containing protein n=1 Tax=Hondaea fermentalgiana TaxID=2315210 RepID=A0A2R5G844_9STRA|nr:Hypothetical Protein FCC1311_034442 [Hondaea fermentalgiana]|eukprot:GBG27222.1 Hypothetical Protein FCC1311_034442 [Hondaea fermentalgiana]